MPKRQRNSKKHSMFDHLLLKLRGGGVHIHAIWNGMSGQAHVHGGGGGVPPPRNWKKRCCQRNFNLFHLCFTNEIMGESIHYTCKMEGWADRRASMVGGGRGNLAPPRNWKKDAVRGNFNLFHLDGQKVGHFLITIQKSFKPIINQLWT